MVRNLLFSLLCFDLGECVLDVLELFSVKD